MPHPPELRDAQLELYVATSALLEAADVVKRKREKLLALLSTSYDEKSGEAKPPEQEAVS